MSAVDCFFFAWPGSNNLDDDDDDVLPSETLKYDHQSACLA